MCAEDEKWMDGRIYEKHEKRDETRRARWNRGAGKVVLAPSAVAEVGERTLLIPDCFPLARRQQRTRRRRHWSITRRPGEVCSVASYSISQIVSSPSSCRSALSIHIAAGWREKDMCMHVDDYGLYAYNYYWPIGMKQRLLV